MEQRFFIGEVLKPQGILGEVKIKPYTDNAERFLKLKTVFLEEEEHKILRARVGGDGFVFLALSGVYDRNAAELLRGKRLFVPRENATPLKKNTYYIADVLGCRVVAEDGTDYGTVTDVTQAARDIYTLQTPDGKVARFPFLKQAVAEVDVEEKRISVVKRRMEEVLCYED